VLLFLLSCKEEKVEFVQSRAIPALILIKNPPKSDSLLKTQIIDFLQANNKVNMVTKQKTMSSFFILHLLNVLRHPAGWIVKSQNPLIQLSMINVQNIIYKFL